MGPGGDRARGSALDYYIARGLGGANGAALGRVRVFLHLAWPVEDHGLAFFCAEGRPVGDAALVRIAGTGTGATAEARELAALVSESAELASSCGCPHRLPVSPGAENAPCRRAELRREVNVAPVERRRHK